MARARAAEAMKAQDVADLLEVEVDEGVGVAPLTPEQARKRADRQQRVQRRIKSETDRHAAKMGDLRADMADT